MRIGRAIQALALAVAVTAVLAGCQAAAGSEETDGSTADGVPAIFPDSQISPLVAAVPHRSVAPPPPMRLARGLVPPTNRWYSGLIFGDAPLRVFPFPISFALTASGFSFGLPTVNAKSAVITGGNAPLISVDAGATDAIATAYDDVSVTLEYRTASGASIGHTTIAEGSPLVGFTADSTSPVTLSLSLPFASVATSSPAGAVATAEMGGHTYALISPHGALSDSGSAVRLSNGQSIVMLPLPSGAKTSAVVAAISGPLLGVSTTYATSSTRATTTLGYRARGDATVFGTLPSQTNHTASGGCSLGHYETIYGTMTLCSGDRLSWTVPLVTANGSLPLGSISASDRSAILTQLRVDAASTAALPADTYFGGKALYRLANLLDIARQLGATDIAHRLRSNLAGALTEWTDPKGCATSSSRCFVYDPAVRGIVGLTASFGSDQFNDHHFHYGYFLYAAGVLAADDPSVVKRLSPVIDLLAADLATSGSGTLFPQRRTFDPYTGHSWASGFSPFADGNNQESSSEAVNAWNGLALWAAASGQTALHTEATWMLSSETAAARSDWTETDLTGFPGFTHSIVALNWGGKRDYATWFSPDPNAMLGIQLIPMSPVFADLAGDPKRIRANVAEATPSGFDVQFGDYLLMYSALAGAGDLAHARATAATLPDASIDDADSRTYLLAWLASVSSG